jgi:hypothetical protein
MNTVEQTKQFVQRKLKAHLPPPLNNRPIKISFLAIKPRRMKWADHVARVVKKSFAYRVLVGKPEGKRSLGRPRRRWEDGIKMDLQGVELGGIEWFDLAQDRDKWRAFLNAVMKLRV